MGVFLLCKEGGFMSEQKKKPTPKKTEKLSKKDIEELMGVNKSVYTRHNGAIRRK